MFFLRLYKFFGGIIIIRFSRTWVDEVMAQGLAQLAFRVMKREVSGSIPGLCKNFT